MLRFALESSRAWRRHLTGVPKGKQHNYGWWFVIGTKAAENVHISLRKNESREMLSSRVIRDWLFYFVWARTGPRKESVHAYRIANEISPLICSPASYALLTHNTCEFCFCFLSYFFIFIRKYHIHDSEFFVFQHKTQTVQFETKYKGHYLDITWKMSDREKLR